jgi:hypothetical protein
MCVACNYLAYSFFRRVVEDKNYKNCLKELKSHPGLHQWFQLIITYAQEDSARTFI